MTAESRELANIAVDLLDEPDDPIRKMASPEAMDQLRSSVASRGVLVPLVVVRRGERFEVVAGLRRLLAARAAGIEQVPCVVMPKDASEEAWAMFVENRLRESVNALDEALWLQRVLKTEGLSARDMATRLGVSESWISQRLAILVWPEDVRSALAEGWLGYAVARELAGIAEEQSRRQALRMAKVGGCTARQAADWRRQSELADGLVEQGGRAGSRENGRSEPPAIETRCELCVRVVAELDQRILLLCPECRQAVQALRDQYAAESKP